MIALPPGVHATRGVYIESKSPLVYNHLATDFGLLIDKDRKPVFKCKSIAPMDSRKKFHFFPTNFRSLAPSRSEITASFGQCLSHS